MPVTCRQMGAKIRVVEKSSGEIDKNADNKKFSHITDALGYYIESKYPVSGSRTTIVEQI